MNELRAWAVLLMVISGGVAFFANHFITQAGSGGIPTSAMSMANDIWLVSVGGFIVGTALLVAGIIRQK